MKAIDEIGFLYIYVFSIFYVFFIRNRKPCVEGIEHRNINVCWDGSEILSYYRHVLPKTIINGVCDGFLMGIFNIIYK